MSFLKRHLLSLLLPIAGLVIAYAVYSWPRIFYSALPIPLAFLLWRRIAEREITFPQRFSLYAFAISVGGFALVISGASGKKDVLALATAAGLFVLTPFTQDVRYALKNKRLAAIALYAAFSIYLYDWLNGPLWGYMYRPTASALSVAFALIGLHPDMSFQLMGGGVNVVTPTFAIQVFNGCSGLEGVTLFSLMLSVMLMLDWDYYRTRKVMRYYLFGIVYMLAVNVLRIALLVRLGDWAYRPGAGRLAESLQGAPVWFFHSIIGWSAYLLAFWLFSGVITRRRMACSR